MHILCDTCSILMLIRIAPNMFIDDRYQCCTLAKVREEIFRTQRFKTQYPWRNKYKNKISCLPNIELITNDHFANILNTINLLIDNNIINERSGRLFDLSRVDKELLACALSNGYRISSGDSEIKDLALQEFSEIYKGSISPLGLVNKWLKLDLIEANETLQNYLSDWNHMHEDPQPKKQKTIYRRVTGCRYIGS